MFIFVVSLILSIVIFSNIAIINVHGRSMEPALLDGDTVLLKKKKEEHRGDIVVVEVPEDWGHTKRRWVKRLVGIEGDKFDVGKNKIYRNNEFLSDIQWGNCKRNGSFIVNQDEIIVLGDNRKESEDSISKFCKGEEFKLKRNSIIYSSEKMIRLNFKK